MIDIRNQLPRASWSIGSERHKTSVTLHYNGPAVPVARQRGSGLRAQLRIDCDYQMRPGWAGTSHGADGLQYHYVVDADGVVYQTRDEDAVLWHCAHAVGNAHSIAVHLPLGGAQEPTGRQWSAVVHLCDSLLSRYDLDGREHVKGHFEWSRSACPGSPIKRLLREYRSQPATIWFKPPQPHKTIRETLVHQSPDGKIGVAMVLPEGETVQIGALVQGIYRAWIANGTGFVNVADLVAVEGDKPIVQPEAVTVNSAIMHAPRASLQTVVGAVCSRPTGEYTRYDLETFILPAYWQVCERVGVDPLIAVAQACHETGNFTSWWAARPRRNPAGLGVTGEPGEGLSFPTWARHAIPAHVGRLVAYAVLPEDQTDAQQALVHVALAARWLPHKYYGIAPTLDGLSGTWATDSGYAGKVARWANKLQEGAQ